MWLMKRTIAVVLCVTLILATAPVSCFVGAELPVQFDFKAEAATYFVNCGDGLTSVFNQETGVLEIKGTGAMTDWEDSLSAPWDSYRDSIKAVKVNEGVTTIGSCAFLNCTNLSSITLADTVQSIGDSSFAGCASLESISLPAGLADIGLGAFQMCIKLESVKVESGNRFFYSDTNGVLFNAERNKLILYPSGKTDTSYTVPNEVSTIGTGAFLSAVYLEELILPETVSIIEEYAFAGCMSLETISLPMFVGKIPNYAFLKCYKLKSIDIPFFVSSIGEYAFSDCDSLESVSFATNIQTIEQNAFSGCGNLTTTYFTGTEDEWNSIFIKSGNEALPPATFVERGSCGDNLIWKLNKNSGLLTISGIGAMENYADAAEAPWYFDKSYVRTIIVENGVSTISSCAFHSFDNLTKITIGDSVKSIGECAIYACKKLSEIQVDKNNNYFSNDNYGVLYNKNKTVLLQYPCNSVTTNYIIPSTVTTISNRAFYWCDSLVNITIPNSVTYIGDFAFRECDSLTSLTIPISVTYIGDRAFSGCTLKVDGDNKFYSSDSYGALFDKSKNKLLYFPSSITNTSYVIPDSVTCIGIRAFDGCDNLTEIIIGKAVTTIDERAFEGCQGLTNITIPGNVKTIGYSAFYSCLGITNLIIENGVTTIDNTAFGFCLNLKSVSLPCSMTSIGVWAFNYCNSLTDVYFNGTEEQWNKVAIGDKNEPLTSATIHFAQDIITDPNGSCGSNLTWVFDEVLQVLTISGTGDMTNWSSSSEVPWYNYLSNIKTVKIGNNVTSIGNYAFAYCDNLSSITIGNSVETIGEDVFRSCGSLTSITIPDSVISIESCAFYECSNLTTITLGDNVKSIGNNAFYECYNLKNVTFPDSLISIGNYAFYYCYAFTNVNIPDNVTCVGEQAFYDCFNLKNITIGKNVKTLGWQAFFMCGNLTDITVDDENKYYSSDNYGVLFNKDKTNLILYPMGNLRKSYTIPDCVIMIGDNAFEYAKNLTNIVIPNSKITIGAFAFFYCSNLTSITLGKSVKAIENCAFINCYNLSDVYYGGTKEQWNTVSIGRSNEPLISATIHYLGQEDFYNLGDETYSFDNYSDRDSSGHCFGMSMTSAGYHIGSLDINTIGGNEEDGLYSLSETSKVKEPICYYQGIQASYSRKSIVAGGNYYKNWHNDISSDWKAVVNYVKSHEYDNKGTLQIGYRQGKSGHAINFLRYEVVNGQERIYAYDNNFPDTEVYFYKAENGDILQAPYATFDGEIDCIALRSVEKYFNSLGDYNATRYIFADENEISIPGAIAYPVDCGADKERVVFEIPEGEEKVVIVPLVENAEFEYLNVTYNFEQAEEGQAGEFILAQDEETAEDTVELTFIDFPQNIEIKTPSTTTVNYGETLILHADFGEVTLPEGYTILWTVEGAGFNMAPATDGLTCKMTSVANGNATVKATIVDENGEAVLDADGNEMFDTQELKSNAGFWQKIVSFFKNLFRISRIILQSI